MSRSDDSEYPRQGSRFHQSANHPVLFVDSYANGISIGRADSVQQGGELRLGGDEDRSIKLRSRYVSRGSEPLVDLERHMERLSARGELRSTAVIFGVMADPFFPFDENFATSMKFLKIFERYQPGRLIIQTRSPLIVLGLPVLKNVKKHTHIVIGLETPNDEVRRRYTPVLPEVEERWKVIRTLRAFDLKVGIQVAPILPYGDWRRDADAFAAQLVDAADFISVKSLAQRTPGKRPNCVTARMLAADRNFFWLRHDTHLPLTEAIARRDESKLIHPGTTEVVNPQIPLFA